MSTPQGHPQTDAGLPNAHVSTGQRLFGGYTIKGRDSAWLTMHICRFRGTASRCSPSGVPHRGSILLRARSGRPHPDLQATERDQPRSHDQQKRPPVHRCHSLERPARLDHDRQPPSAAPCPRADRPDLPLAGPQPSQVRGAPGQRSRQQFSYLIGVDDPSVHESRDRVLRGTFPTSYKLSSEGDPLSTRSERNGSPGTRIRPLYAVTELSEGTRSVGT